MGGVPCIRDLRVAVGMVLGQLAGGLTVDEVLGDYPYLEGTDVLAALECAWQSSTSARCRSPDRHEAVEPNRRLTLLRRVAILVVA